MRRLAPSLLLLGLAACGGPADSESTAPDRPTGEPFEVGGEGARYPGPYNILFVLADDLGIDKVGAYGAHPNPPPTPNIDALADRGVLFRNTWVLPTCSPTRAALLTGRYPRRYGIGDWISPQSDAVELPLAEVTVPEALARARPEMSNAMAGKWHLGQYADLEEAKQAPNMHGFDWYAGSMANITNMYEPDSDQPRGYYYWEKTTNGQVAFTDVYATTDTANDALDRMEAMPEPWFLYVSFNAPHEPTHLPPRDLFTMSVVDASRRVDKQDAMVEALDTEIGRMLDGMDPEVRAHTVIVFLSDNGSPDFAIRWPHEPSHSKGTLWEGGVNVPLIVAGPVVTHPGTESTALVSAVDFFPTFLELAGASYDDGVDRPGTSFLRHVRDPELRSTRDVLLSERFYPNGSGPYDSVRTGARNERYKYAITDGVESFFEMVAPYDEGPDIPPELRTTEQWRQYEVLRARTQQHLASIPTPDDPE